VRYLRKLSLAVGVVAIFIAFAGAQSASAAELCTTTPLLPCSEKFAAGDKIKAPLEAGTESIIGGAIALNCSESSIGAETTVAGKGRIIEATWAKCAPACIVNPIGLPWNLTYAPVAGGPNGTVTVEKPKIRINCGIPCNVEAAGAVTFEFIAGMGGLEAEDPKISAVKVAMAGCGGADEWSAGYRVTSATMGGVKGNDPSARIS